MLPEETEGAAVGSGFGEEGCATWSDEATTKATAENGGGGEEGGGSAVAMAEGLKERRGRCLAWCLDHGFEYVEADCRDPDRGWCCICRGVLVGRGREVRGQGAGGYGVG